jgi:hypothetical protein
LSAPDEQAAIPIAMTAKVAAVRCRFMGPLQPSADLLCDSILTTWN